MGDYQFYIALGAVVSNIATVFGGMRVMWARMNRFEDKFDRKLNNGIRSDIQSIQISIAKMQSDIENA